ncbi:MAG: DUF1857 family protein [Proteobacteria bacterium]|nr:DUF1857 family protein [Pseudomonadota bacterium]
MRYEHLVQINDPDQPAIAPLARSQLWSGLRSRAEEPSLFDPTIDARRELRYEATLVEHELRRGAHAHRETVHLDPDRSIRVSVGAGNEYAGSTLTIRIEEPAPSALFLRFVYEIAEAAVPTDEGERQALRHAYFHADLDFVRRLRALAADEGTG